MAESLTFQLRKGSKLTSCVAVKIRYADMNTHTKQLRIGYTACDHIILPPYTSCSARCTIVDNGSAWWACASVTWWVAATRWMPSPIRRRPWTCTKRWTRSASAFGDRTVMRASGMDAKSIGRMDNPFDGQAPVLLANRRT
jgi:DNA polymerase-4